MVCSARAAGMKQVLRQQMRRVRSRLTLEDLAWAETEIHHRVLALPEVQRAKRVLCYLSARREVPTQRLVETFRQRGLDLAVPRITGPGQMEARRYQLPLVDGAFGIATSNGPALESVDICICPGLAFDRAGRRLGYGGGYYDAWLAQARPFTVALAISEALVDNVPAEAHDWRMDVVVTPHETIYVGSH